MSMVDDGKHAYHECRRLFRDLSTHSGSSNRLADVVHSRLVHNFTEFGIHQLLAKLGKFQVVALPPADLEQT